MCVCIGVHMLMYVCVRVCVGVHMCLRVVSPYVCVCVLIDMCRLSTIQSHSCVYYHSVHVSTIILFMCLLSLIHFRSEQCSIHQLVSSWSLKLCAL